MSIHSEPYVINMRKHKKCPQGGCSEGKTATLFFLLSGEHPTLPFSELKAILEAEGHRHQILERLIQVLRVRANLDAVRSIAFRSAMTRVCGRELFNCGANAAEIIKKMREASLEGLIEGDKSFAVRLRRIRGSAPHIMSAEWEQKLGELILNKAKGIEVDLTKPKKTFFGVLTENRFIFGLKMTEVSPKPFIERKPRKRPFFHPTAMPAKLARCMVNLAKPKIGELVLDPFCGTASIPVEAGLIGCRVMGLDVQRHMVEGSLKNLLYYGVKPEGMAVADARHLPVSKADCIVTDPPYGRSATTLGLTTGEVVYDMLREVIDVLPGEGRICMASPKSIRIGRMGKALGFRHVESHYVYVHRSLTREVAVFERT